MLFETAITALRDAPVQASTTASITSDHVRCHPQSVRCSSARRLQGRPWSRSSPDTAPFGRRDRRWSRGSPPPVPPAGMRPRCSKRTTPAERHTPWSGGPQPVSTGSGQSLHRVRTGSAQVRHRSARGGRPLPRHPRRRGPRDRMAIISRHGLDHARTVEHCVGRRFSHPDLVMAVQAVCPMRGPSPISGAFPPMQSRMHVHLSFSPNVLRSGRSRRALGVPGWPAVGCGGLWWAAVAVAAWS